MGKAPVNPGSSGGSKASDRYEITKTLERWSSLLPAGASVFTSIRPSEESGVRSPELRLRSFVLERERVAGDAGNADYEILELIGRGGMGTVHAGRQRSLNRIVAVKILDRGGETEENRRQFLTEAAIIGTLDHPNIVPIHELGEDAGGELFYSMKMIRGTPWNECMKEKGLRENLEILLRVCDAVAFAHSHGIIHRDLKPHNVMIGDFGEVLVVDWGLAVSVGGGDCPAPLTEANVHGGTVAYMAPEMALGIPEDIGFHSDIYLLGAILFQIITGRPPHGGETVLDTILAAARNVILPHEDDGELMAVALQAMETDPAARHAAVRDFQTALRQYLSHEESIVLCQEAEGDLERALEKDDYELFRRSVFGFEQALKLWKRNARAQDGSTRARGAWARCALRREDLDLAASLIPQMGTVGKDLEERVLRARRRRDSRRRRIRVLARTAVALTALVVAVLSVSLVMIIRERSRVRHAEAMASRQRNLALKTLDTVVDRVDSELAKRPAMQDLRRYLLDLAIEGLDEVSDSVSEKAPVDLRLAAAHQSMARIFHAARRNEQAKRHELRAIGILEELSRQGAAVPPLELARAYEQMGNIEHNFNMGNLQAARGYYLKAMEAMRRGHPDDLESLLELDRLYEDLGDVSLDMDEKKEAERWYAEAANLAGRLSRGHGGQEAVLTARTDSLMRQGDLAEAFQRDVEARRYFEEALRILGGIQEPSPGIRRRKMLVLQRLGENAAKGPGGNGEAGRYFARARSIGEELVSSDSTNGQYRRDLLVSIWFQGDLERDSGRTKRARMRYLEAIDIARGLLALNPDNAEARRDLFICCNRVGDMDMRSGDDEEARTYYRRGLEISEGLASENPGNLGAQTDLVVSHYKLGELAEHSGDHTGAMKHWERCAEILHGLKASGRIGKGSRYQAWIEDVDRKLSGIGN